MGDFTRPAPRSGSTSIEVSQGEAIKVASISFDPGYSLEESLPEVSKADLIRGYATYGKSIGD
jgi:hypothetical protein